jgi:hypothetical protein
VLDHLDEDPKRGDLELAAVENGDASDAKASKPVRFIGVDSDVSTPASGDFEREKRFGPLIDENGELVDA